MTPETHHDRNPIPIDGAAVSGHDPVAQPTKDGRPAFLPGLWFGAAWGCAIFAASLPLAGHVEPWDGLPGYYPFALLLGGILAAFSLRVRPAALWVGVVIGQEAYVVFLSKSGPGNLWPIGLLFAMAASLLIVAGWYAGTLFKSRPWLGWLSLHATAALAVWTSRDALLDVGRSASVVLLKWRTPDLEWKLIRFFVDIGITAEVRWFAGAVAVAAASVVAWGVARRGIAFGVALAAAVWGAVAAAAALGVDLAGGFTAFVVPALLVFVLVESFATFRGSWSWLRVFAWTPLIGLLYPCASTRVLRGTAGPFAMAASLMILGVVGGLTYRSPLSDVELGERLALRLRADAAEGRAPLVVDGPVYTPVAASNDLVGVTGLAPSRWIPLDREGSPVGTPIAVDVPELEQVGLFPDGSLRHFTNTGDAVVVVDPLRRTTSRLPVALGRPTLACSTRCVADPTDPSRMVVMKEFENEGWILAPSGAVVARFVGTLHAANMAPSRRDGAVYWNFMGGSSRLGRYDVARGHVHFFEAPAPTGDLRVREESGELWVSLPTRAEVAVYTLPKAGETTASLVRLRPAPFGVRGLAIDEARGVYAALGGVGGRLEVRRLIDDALVASPPTAPWARKVEVLPGGGRVLVTTAGGALVVRY